jgi:hypothetical protein
MPVIIKSEAEAVGLDPAIDTPDKVTPIAGPYPADLVAAAYANPALNRPSFEGPGCLHAPAA